MSDFDFDRIITKGNGTNNNPEKNEIEKKQNYISKICETLQISSAQYDIEKTMEVIRQYVDDSNKFKSERVLYSEISNYIYALEEEDRGNFVTNIEKLLEASINSNKEISDKCVNVIVKIYDHVQLAIYQIENIDNRLAERVLSTKNTIHGEIKGIEKEYITILGIFASIVLAFVGGITFSTSIMQHISEVSIYRLLIVLDVLGAILMNLLVYLFNFVLYINNAKKRIKPFTFNAIFCMCAIVIFLSWLMEIDKLRTI